VAFTYNDPVVFHEYAIDVARACRRVGVRTVAVTAGQISPEPRVHFFEAMDAANVDLKAISERFYRRLCSASLQPVLDTLLYVKRETDVWLEITNLVIPGWNDADDDLRALAGWVVQALGPDVPLHFSAVHPDHRMRDVPPTPPATLARACTIAREEGVRHAYTGNVVDRTGATTTCHACGRALVVRAGYSVATWHLTAAGACDRCGTPCAGVFAARPGTWGARRLPVRLAEPGGLWR
jgi:pyruvate formate lyase activating enzyme